MVMTGLVFQSGFFLTSNMFNKSMRIWEKPKNPDEGTMMVTVAILFFKLYNEYNFLCLNSKSNTNMVTIK